MCDAAFNFEFLRQSDSTIIENISGVRQFDGELKVRKPPSSGGPPRSDVRQHQISAVRNRFKPIQSRTKLDHFVLSIKTKQIQILNPKGKKWTIPAAPKRV